MTPLILLVSCCVAASAGSQAADTLHLEVGSPEVNAQDVTAWRVEERVHATGALKATWWLIDVSPYMVLAEIPLPNGQTQRITGVALD